MHVKMIPSSQKRSPPFLSPILRKHNTLLLLPSPVFSLPWDWANQGLLKAVWKWFVLSETPTQKHFKVVATPASCPFPSLWVCPPWRGLFHQEIRFRNVSTVFCILQFLGWPFSLKNCTTVEKAMSNFNSFSKPKIPWLVFTESSVPVLEWISPLLVDFFTWTEDTDFQEMFVKVSNSKRPNFSLGSQKKHKPWLRIISLHPSTHPPSHPPSHQPSSHPPIHPPSHQPSAIHPPSHQPSAIQPTNIYWVPVMYLKIQPQMNRQGLCCHRAHAGGNVWP